MNRVSLGGRGATGRFAMAIALLIVTSATLPASGQVDLQIPALRVVPLQNVSHPIYASTADIVVGYQLSLTIDDEAMTFDPLDPIQFVNSATGIPSLLAINTNEIDNAPDEVSIAAVLGVGAGAPAIPSGVNRVLFTVDYTAPLTIGTTGAIQFLDTPVLPILISAPSPIAPDSMIDGGFEVVLPSTSFLRGDVNGDGSIGLADAIALLGVLFSGMTTSCTDAADFDNSGSLNLQDAINILGYLFQGGSPPFYPFPEPGLDPESSAGCP